jgi:hypothetical protein
VFDYINLEKGLILGALMILVGFYLSLEGIASWRTAGFGELNTRSTMRLIIPAITLLQLGVQAVLFSFFFSILGLKK